MNTMAESPVKVCAFCGQKDGGECESLKITKKKVILAHYNCLLFAPRVTTAPSAGSQDGTPEFNIASVRNEIKRGKKLSCSHCKKRGATVGCNEETCKKSYHYPCVSKARGKCIRDEEKEIYLAYCSIHWKEPQGGEASTSSHQAQGTHDNTTPVFSLGSTRPRQDSQSTTTSGIPVMIAELKRGKVRCSHCDKIGATVGCNEKACKKTYHYYCVPKARGVLQADQDTHIAYCFEHSENNQGAQETEEIYDDTSVTGMPSGILNDQQGGTNDRSDGSYSSAAASESSVLIQASGGQTASSTYVQADVGQPNSSGELLEDGGETILTDEDIRVLAEFPGNVNNPMNLNTEQKNHLLESYKKIEKWMSRSRNMEAGKAQAFWDLCQKNGCQESLLTFIACCMKSVIHNTVQEEPKEKDDQENMNCRSENGSNNGIYPNSVGFPTEEYAQEEFVRDEDPDGMESESLETPSISYQVELCARENGHNKADNEWSETSPLVASSKVKKSSRDCNGMPSKSSSSSSESTRKDELFRDEGHGGVQCESSSESRMEEEGSIEEEYDGTQGSFPLQCNRKEECTREEYLNRMEIKLSEASPFLPSTSNSDQIPPENTFCSPIPIPMYTLQVLKSQQEILPYQQKQQTEDGDAGFATILMQHLRKVPEDKKLSTQIAILNVLRSVLDQQ